MHTLEITGYKTVHYASGIEELSRDEFIYFMQLYFQQQSGLITIDDFRRLLAFKLLRIKKTAKYFTMSDADRMIVHDHINRIVKTLDSFYEYADNNGSLVQILVMSWIQQMLPAIGKLVGPDHALTNCTIFEYKEAFTQMNEYRKTRNDENLNRLIAILYRPRKKFYRIRNRFSAQRLNERIEFTEKTNPAILERRIETVKRIPSHIKLAIFLWFENCVEYIVTGHPTIDGIELDFSVLFSKNTDETGPSGIGLTGIIYSLAESSVFGTADQTSNTNLYDVLVRLYQLKTDYDAMIAKSRKNDKD